MNEENILKPTHSRFKSPSLAYFPYGGSPSPESTEAPVGLIASFADNSLGQIAPAAQLEENVSLPGQFLDLSHADRNHRERCSQRVSPQSAAWLQKLQGLSE